MCWWSPAITTAAPSPGQQSMTQYVFGFSLSLQLGKVRDRLAQAGSVWTLTSLLRFPTRRLINADEFYDQATRLCRDISVRAGFKSTVKLCPLMNLSAYFIFKSYMFNNCLFNTVWIQKYLRLFRHSPH